MRSRYTKAPLVILASILLGAGIFAGCTETVQGSSDQLQQQQQEQILKEGTAEIGMPAIVNFHERKQLKDLLELRDQANLVTYTYLDNELSRVVPGTTALGGKLTFLGTSIGYGLPYSTQFTNPEKMVTPDDTSGYHYLTLPQADPNGLFSPASASGTWVMLKDPSGKDTKPVYIESNIFVSPFKLKFD